MFELIRNHSYQMNLNFSTELCDVPVTYNSSCLSEENFTLTAVSHDRVED